MLRLKSRPRPSSFPRCDAEFRNDVNEMYPEMMLQIAKGLFA